MLFHLSICGLQHLERAHGNWTMFKALWFVVVTFSTVGYGDTVPRDNLSRTWVMIMIIMALLILPAEVILMNSELCYQAPFIKLCLLAINLAIFLRILWFFMQLSLRVRRNDFRNGEGCSLWSEIISEFSLSLLAATA